MSCRSVGHDYKGEPGAIGWPDINSHFGVYDIVGKSPVCAVCCVKSQPMSVDIPVSCHDICRV